MSRRILLLSLSALVLLCACSAQPEEQSIAESLAEHSDDGRLVQLEQTVSELQKQLADCESKRADWEYRAGELTDKWMELEDALLAEQETVSSLLEENQALQDKLDGQTRELVHKQLWTDDGTVYHVEDPSTFEERLYIKHNDGSVTEIFAGSTIEYVGISSDRKKLIWNDYEWEYNATVYIYDIETGKLTVQPMDDLGENDTPSFMAWFDERYFLFVVQFDHGTIAVGGDVYVYDTEADTYRKLIGVEDPRMMIASFERRWETLMDAPAPLLFSVAYYDEGYAEHEELLYGMTHEELLVLIENGETLTFEVKNGF